MRHHVVAKMLLIVFMGAASIWLAVRYNVFAVPWFGAIEEFFLAIGRMVIVNRITKPFVRLAVVCLIILFGATTVARAQKRIVALFACAASWTSGLWQRTPRVYRVVLYALSVPIIGFIGWGMYLFIWFLPGLLFRKANALAIDRALDRWFWSRYRPALRKNGILKKIRAPYRAVECIALRRLRRLRKQHI